MITWLKKLFTRKPKQTCWCFCQSCNVDLCSTAIECVDPDEDGYVQYLCKCGARSQWDFDLPVPWLVTHNGEIYKHNDAGLMG